MSAPFLSRRRLFHLLAASGALFAADRPKRNMIVRSQRPEDFEMPMDGFTDWITPTDRFFVRSHHYSPSVTLADWKLQVDGEVERPVTLTFEELKKLPRAEVVSVLECAGNGRGLYDPPVIGTQWEYGAVGNGRWMGVRLADVLKRAGVKSSSREVLFDGADIPVGSMPEFQRTVPLTKALDPNTLLAYEMNGEALPVSHGFPLRLVVPGWAGDSWVKWVTHIRVLDKEFDGFFMKTAYRYPNQSVAPGTAVDPAQMSPVTALRTKSVIATPVEGAILPRNAVRIAGAAWSGESPVASVEVSTDRGRTWQAAKLDTNKSRFGWRLWEHTWNPQRDGYQTIMSRARDAAGNSQPLEQEWNPSGYLNGMVHTVHVSVNGTAPAATPTPPAKPTYSPKFRSACLSCHEADIIEQQRLTQAQWEREVDKMINWGAPARGQDRREIVDFLVRAFGPRPRR